MIKTLTKYDLPRISYIEFVSTMCSQDTHALTVHSSCASQRRNPMYQSKASKWWLGSLNQAEPAENILHSEAYATCETCWMNPENYRYTTKKGHGRLERSLNLIQLNIMPWRWTCMNEVRQVQGANSTELDLLIRDSKGDKYTGHEFMMDWQLWKISKKALIRLMDTFPCLGCVSCEFYLNLQLPPLRSEKNIPIWMSTYKCFVWWVQGFPVSSAWHLVDRTKEYG